MPRRDGQRGGQGPDAADASGAGDSIAAVITEFGLRLLAELFRSQPPQNIVISPTSLVLALMVVLNGAAGETQKAIAATIGLSGPNLDHANRAGASLLAALQEPAPQGTLAYVTALWANAGIRFPQDFLERVQRSYAASAMSIDFAAPDAVQTVNEWVSRETRGQIDTLVTSADVAPAADCILTNALYFKGLWAVQFDPGATTDGAFTLPNGWQKIVPRMSQSGRFGYLETERFQAVSLPYGEGRLSMYLFLPAASSSLEVFLGHLSLNAWEGWMAGFRETEVDLTLPRASLTYEAEMKEPLTSLGMGEAFKPGADFTPMGLAGRSITRVKHKIRTEMNEEGTESSAVTAVVMTRSLPRRVYMAVDRPFFFAIRDNHSGILLFVGAVMEPS